MIFTIPITAILIAGALFLLFYSFEWTDRSPYFLRLTKDPIIQSLVVDILPACGCIVGAISLIGGMANPWLIGALLTALSALLFLKTLRCDLSKTADFAFMGLSILAGVMALNTLATAALLDCLL